MVFAEEIEKGKHINKINKMNISKVRKQHNLYSGFYF